MTEYKITENMRKRRSSKEEALAAVVCDLYFQKYNRLPTIVEFFNVEDEITEVAEMIYNNLFPKKKRRRSA